MGVMDSAFSTTWPSVLLMLSTCTVTQVIVFQKFVFLGSVGGWKGGRIC